MGWQRISYEFTIRLPVSRERAYRWATDYRPNDFRLMGIDARRAIRRLAPDTILLTDSFGSDPFGATPGRRTVKVKLVHLYPRRWAWTSTHVSGPALYSQFSYELTPIGRNACRLRFRGNQLERVARTPTRAFTAQRARTLRLEDSRLWRNLAKSLTKDASASAGP